MKPASSTLASVANFGAGTVSNLVAGLCATSLGLAFAIRQNAIVALSVFGLAGLLWLLGWAHRKPKSGSPAASVNGIKINRIFVIRDLQARRALQKVSVVLVGIGSAVLIVSAGLGLQKTQAERDADRRLVQRIDETTSASHDELAQISDQLAPIVDDYIARLLEHEAKLASLANELRTVEDERNELRERVKSALGAKAVSEVAAGKSPEQVLHELRKESPQELLEFLNETVADETAAFEAHRDALVARHRERAAIAYILGNIQQANESLQYILSIIPDDIESITRLGLSDYHLGDLAGAHERFLQAMDVAPNDVWKATLSVNIGRIYISMGEYEKAEEQLVRAVALFQQLNNRDGLAMACTNLGIIARVQRRFKQAHDYYARALELYRADGSVRGEAISLAGLGSVDYARLENERAEGYIQESTAIFRELGYQREICDNLNMSGLIARGRARIKESNAHLEEALNIAREIEYSDGISNTLTNLAFNKWVEGNYTSARTNYLEALQISEAAGKRDQVAVQLAGLGRVEAYEQQYEVARGYWTRSRDLYHEMGLQPMEAMIQSWLDTLPPE